MRLTLPELSFGCMSLDPILTESEKILKNAFESGISFFDTADLYDKGENEKMVGRALKPVRKEIFLSTKVGNQWREDGSGWDWNPRKEYILKAIDASLKRLGTDYIDLYFLHGGTIEDPIDDTLEAFERLVEQGKILHYGLSSIRPNVVREYVRRSNISAAMTQYSFLDRRAEEEILPLFQENKIPVVARGVLAQGMLSGKEPKAYVNMEASEVANKVNAFRDLAGENASGEAVQFALGNPAVASVVIGIRTEKHLESALASVNHLQSAEKRKELLDLFPANFYTEHR